MLDRREVLGVLGVVAVMGDPTVFRSRVSGRSRTLNLAPNTRIGWVVDARRVAVLARGFVPDPAGLGTRTTGRGRVVHGWVDPATGRRGRFGWQESERFDVVWQLYRGRAAHDLLLMVERQRAKSVDLVWGDANGISTVALGYRFEIEQWDGGDSAVVSDSCTIQRIWRDGRRRLLFHLGRHSGGLHHVR